jgi:hypothetical protein
MTTSRHARRMFLVLPAAMAVAALAGPPAFGATLTPGSGTSTPAPTQAVPGPTSSGFIMSDGRICDPFRMGC